MENNKRNYIISLIAIYLSTIIFIALFLIFNRNISTGIIIALALSVGVTTVSFLFSSLSLIFKEERISNQK